MKIQVIPAIVNHYDDVTVELVDVQFPDFDCVLLPKEHLKTGLTTESDLVDQT